MKSKVRVEASRLRGSGPIDELTTITDDVVEAARSTLVIGIT